MIWLHGLGDTGAGWSFLGKAFAAKLPSFSWQFPSAPERAVTLAPGYSMPAWFDLAALPVTKSTPASVEDFAKSTAFIHALIDKEVAKGVAPEHIVLGGFSQGAALSLYAGLSYPVALGGIVCFSGWLPLWPQLSAAPALAASRVLIVHGRADDKVQFGLGEAARDTLGPRVKSVRFESFGGAHEAPPLGWLEEFLRET
jgi:predicted esterase